MPGTCSDVECERPSLSRGMCGRHYNQWAKRRPDGPRCSEDDCGRPKFAYGMCEMHHGRWRRRGRPGARQPLTLHQRYWRKVDKDGPVPDYAPELGPCWLWTGALHNGYGTFAWSGRAHAAHRVGYEMWLGPVPDGLTLDHLCRVRNCVNPGHLEPVTRAENVMRGEGPCAQHARKTHCDYGHDLTDPANVRLTKVGHRVCQACRPRLQAERKVRERAQRLAAQEAT